jgi:hypothetical protein
MTTQTKHQAIIEEALNSTSKESAVSILEEYILKIEKEKTLLIEQHERFGLGIDEFHRNICNKLVEATK